MTVTRSIILSMTAAVVMSTFVAEANALATREQYQQGTGAYSDQRSFSTRGTAPETVVDMDSPILVGLCNESDSAIVVTYDGEKQTLDAGDCIDVEASKVGAGAEKEGANGHGSYHVGPSRDPEARRGRTE